MSLLLILIFCYVCLYFCYLNFNIDFFGDLEGRYIESKIVCFFKGGNYRKVSTVFVKYNFCYNLSSFQSI